MSQLLQKYINVAIRYSPISQQLFAYKIAQDTQRFKYADKQEQNQIIQSYIDIISNYGPVGEFRLGLELPFDVIRLGQYIQHGDDYNDGVWIGTRGLGALYNQQFTPLIAHWCCNIDGNNFSLTTDNGSADGKIQIQETNDKERYEWYRYGKNQKPLNDIRQFVRYINDQQIPYQLIADNCQKFSLIIARFATKENEPQYIISSRIFTFKDLIDKEQFIQQKHIQTLKQFIQKENRNQFIQNKIQQQEKQQRNFEKQGFQLYEEQEEQMSNKLYQIGRVTTIGQNNYKLPTTIGNYNSGYSINRGVRGGSKSSSVFQPTNYSQAFITKNDRYEKSNNTIYGPSLYSNQPSFNLYANPNINNGFLGNNPLQATIRKGNNFEGQNNSNYSSFQGINYNLQKQTLKNLQPFNNKYQIQNNSYEKQPFKKVNTQGYTPQGLQPPSQNYLENDYTNQQDYEEEIEQENNNNQIDYSKPDPGYTLNGIKYARY